eukprot:TRINITY_DN4833_c0_g1_i1.p1 TRINITY_DN4833_c0_g1~~TRINITY_DN4833_c0_g1_i1.p1  ORF type:complete len:643 (-),score=202.26 TRINITY_DN4833_c0_g1_i1:43-1971(-)
MAYNRWGVLLAFLVIINGTLIVLFENGYFARTGSSKSKSAAKDPEFGITPGHEHNDNDERHNPHVPEKDPQEFTKEHHHSTHHASIGKIGSQLQPAESKGSQPVASKIGKRAEPEEQVVSRQEPTEKRRKMSTYFYREAGVSTEFAIKKQQSPYHPIDETKYGVERFKKLLQDSVEPYGEPWIFEPTKWHGLQVQSTPYQPTIIEKEPPPPKVLLEGDAVVPDAVLDENERITETLKAMGREKTAKMFANCYPNTLATTAALLDDNSTYIITGDIDLMWLRDSSAQVHQYIPLSYDPEVQRIIEGLIKRQFFFIKRSPYGASFRTKLRDEDDLGAFHVSKARNLYTSMHNYELDSLCYPIALSYQYWKASGKTSAFTKEWKYSAEIILNLWITEQNHATESPYRYIELGNNWRGDLSGYTGMTWSAFRPSDDQCRNGYLVPSNMFAAVALEYLEEIFLMVYNDKELAAASAHLRADIEDGIAKYAIVDSPNGKKMYAYEVDGKGGVNMMDDANVPSLLSIDYIGYRGVHDPDGSITRETRKFILSDGNPFYYKGSLARGIGSPHTSNGFIWPMAIIMQAMTTDDINEVEECLEMLENTDAGTNFMHESFNPNNPGSYSRRWFAWANSLFSELVIRYLDMKNM